MIIEKLIWDSDFFGIKIGKLIINNERDFVPAIFKEQVYNEKYKLVYVFKYQEMLPGEKIISAELELVDIMLNMSKRFLKEKYLNSMYNLKTNLTKKELLECYNIAEETSLVSRFYNEKKIGPTKTKNLYRKWIDSALDKSFCDGLFIVKEQDTVVGIHLIKTKGKIGMCSIIGVNPLYKGKGIGAKLWEQAQGYWANESEIDVCKVPFSFQNSESMNFHLKMGFNKVDEIKYIYHFRSKDKNDSF